MVTSKHEVELDDDSSLSKNEEHDSIEGVEEEASSEVGEYQMI